MKFRSTCLCLLILLYTAGVNTHVEIEAVDYFFPLEPVVNYCKIADQCQHDFVKICGQDSTGAVRTFKDNCDIYEFNCDEKSQYRHVQMDVCGYQQAALSRIGEEEEK